MGAPGVTAEQAAEGEPGAFQGTVDLDGLDAVVAASGIVAADAVAAACHPEPRGNGELVEADQLGEEPGHAGA